MTIFEHNFCNRKDLVRELSEHLKVSLAEAVATRGKSCLALPGGSTPIPIFEALASKDIDWSKITLTLTDDRWVPNTDESSNENLLRKYLLNKVDANFIPLKTEFLSPEKGASKTEQQLEKNCSLMDICVLGMGEDGDVASLFPDSPELVEAMNVSGRSRCTAVNPPNTSLSRISLTLSMILGSGELILLFLGEKKKKVYLTALKSAEYNEGGGHASLRCA